MVSEPELNALFQCHPPNDGIAGLLAVFCFALFGLAAVPINQNVSGMNLIMIFTVTRCILLVYNHGRLSTSSRLSKTLGTLSYGWVYKLALIFGILLHGI